MKDLHTISVSLMFLMALASCSTDSPIETKTPLFSGGIPGGDFDGDTTNVENESNIYFGFLDGDGSSTTYIDMLIDSSASNLLVGRWEITKLGIDENNDGNIIYYEYQDFNHADCGLSFLQFNNDGIVFENSYYNNKGTCTLYSEIDHYEYIEDHRLKIYVYDNIYITGLSDSELILKYDWNFINSLWGPMQTYYHYKRADKSI